MRSNPVALRSSWLCTLFSFYTRWYFGRNFRALRISRAGMPAIPAGRPVIICANHPSWWDPLIYILLMNTLFPRHRGFGPMDQKALGGYGLMRRMGIFGVEPGSMRGAANFLRISNHILQDAAHILWITAEGAFTDSRKRPVTLRPGLAHLARQAENAVIVPMAVEYCFWDERFPEVLVRFGAPIECGGDRRIKAWTSRLEACLQNTMDRLAEDVMSRDAARFQHIRRGRIGIGGLYGAYQRVRAVLQRKRFIPGHDPDGDIA